MIWWYVCQNCICQYTWVITVLCNVKWTLFYKHLEHHIHIEHISLNIIPLKLKFNLHFVLLSLFFLTKWSLQKFTQKTRHLCCGGMFKHFVAIWWTVIHLQQCKVPIQFKLRAKRREGNGPLHGFSQQESWETPIAYNVIKLQWIWIFLQHNLMLTSKLI